MLKRKVKPARKSTTQQNSQEKTTIAPVNLAEFSTERQTAIFKH